MVSINHGIADEPVETPHLALEARLDEPADATEVGEVAHRLPSRDEDGGAVSCPAPELLIHSRVATTTTKERNKEVKRMCSVACMDDRC